MTPSHQSRSLGLSIQSMTWITPLDAGISALYNGLTFASTKRPEGEEGKTLHNMTQYEWYNVTCITSAEKRPLHSLVTQRRLLFKRLFAFLLTWTAVDSNSHLDILVGDKGRNKLSIPQIWAVESTLCHVVHQEFYCQTQWERRKREESLCER